MSVRDEVMHLRRVPLFSSVAVEHLNVLAFAARDRTLKDGKALFKEGDKPRSIYIVIGGEIGLFAGDGAKQQLLKTVGVGTLLGEMALLCDRPHSVTAKAVGELRVIEIAKELLFRSIAEFPDMGAQMMRAVSAKLAQTSQELANVQEKFQTGVKLSDIAKPEST